MSKESEIEYFVYDHRKDGNKHPVNKRTYNTKDSARKAKDRLDSKHGSAIHSVGQRNKTKKESLDFVDTIINEEISSVIEKRKGGKRDGKGASSKGYSLRDWFKGGGWVQAGGKYDGKPCAKQPGQKTKPYCRDPDDRSKLSKKERDKRAKKKRKEDPNPNRRGKAKNVRQKKSKGGKKK